MFIDYWLLVHVVISADICVILVFRKGMRFFMITFWCPLFIKEGYGNTCICSCYDTVFESCNSSSDLAKLSHWNSGDVDEWHFRVKRIKKSATSSSEVASYFLLWLLCRIVFITSEYCELSHYLWLFQCGQPCINSSPVVALQCSLKWNKMSDQAQCVALLTFFE